MSTAFRLMDLPLELRRMIYHECLNCQDRAVNVRPTPTKHFKGSSSSKIPFPTRVETGVSGFGLLLANHQVYCEATEYLVPRALVFSSYVGLNRFLSSANPRVRSLVTEIRVHSGIYNSVNSQVFEAFHALKSHENLEKLVILPKTYNSARYFGWTEATALDAYAKDWFQALRMRTSLDEALRVLDLTLECCRTSEEETEAEVADNKDAILAELCAAP